MNEVDTIVVESKEFGGKVTINAADFNEKDHKLVKVKAADKDVDTSGQTGDDANKKVGNTGAPVTRVPVVKP